MHYLKSASVLEPLKYRFGFVFSPYKLLMLPLEHVSAVQIQLALFQAFYSCVYLGVKEGHIQQNFSLADCLRAEVTRVNSDYRKSLKPEEEAWLDVRLFLFGTDVVVGRKKRPFMRMTFTGFVNGEAEAVA